MVPSIFLRSKTTRCLPVILAALLFVGCGTQQNTDQSAAHLQGNAQADSGYYLQQMQQSSDNSKTNWQLLAIRALLKEGKSQQALALLNQLPQNLNPTQRQQQARYWQDAIAAQQGQPSLTLLRALIAQEPLLASPQDKQKNIDATWQALSSMSKEQANALVINANENVLQGWLDLQRAWFDNRNDPNMMKAGIEDWKTRYPQNPGAKMLPTQLTTNVQTFKPVSTARIALLLPLNGQAAVFGRTIQQGFEAAKNGTVGAVSGSAVPQQAAQAASTQDNAVVSPAQADVSNLTTSRAATGTQANPVQTPQFGAPVFAPQQINAAPVATASQMPAVVTTSASSSAELKIYDTTTAPLNQILNQAQQDGVFLVVGPLLKPDVESLLESNTSLNVLALNQPESVQNRANVCYFALSPEDEARDAARHIHDQGKQAPLVLIPRSSLGDRAANAFTQQWQKLGGGVVLQQKFGSVNELRGGANGSGIALTGSPVSASLQQQGDAQISGGGKIDAAYIVATPEEIAYIKPMIAMRNGSQNGATLYASSRSAQGTAGPDFRLEMDGLQYSEIPMLAGSNPALMQQALSAVRNDYSLARLYAMGVDAWALASRFSQMRQASGFELNGNTGDLSVSQDCVINRKLSWLKYQQGQVVPAN